MEGLSGPSRRADTPDNGASIDPATCEPQGAGHRQPCAVWSDPDFDPAQRAVSTIGSPPYPTGPSLLAPVQLPHGAEITGMMCYARDASATSNLAAGTGGGLARIGPATDTYSTVVIETPLESLTRSSNIYWTSSVDVSGFDRAWTSQSIPGWHSSTVRTFFSARSPAGRPHARARAAADGRCRRAGALCASRSNGGPITFRTWFRKRPLKA